MQLIINCGILFRTLRIRLIARLTFRECIQPRLIECACGIHSFLSKVFALRACQHAARRPKTLLLEHASGKLKLYKPIPKRTQLTESSQQATLTVGFSIAAI